MHFIKDLSNTSWDDVHKRQLARFPLVEEWIALTGMKPGDTVLDIGPGPGAFTLQYASVVGGSGKIIALEKSEEAEAYLQVKLQIESVHHVEVHRGDAEEQIRVCNDGGEINIVMLTDVLHHAENPYLILKNIHSTVSQQAKLLISEFDPRAEGLIGPPLANRIDMAAVKDWAAMLNFEIVADGKQPFEHYYMVLQLAVSVS